MRALVITFSRLISSVVSSQTLETIRARDYITCAVNMEGHGFANIDSSGISRGMGPDLCRVLSTAVLGDPDKVRISHIYSRDQIAMTASGNYDVSIRTTEQTLYTDSFLGVVFTNSYFYDYQTIAVKKSSKIKVPKDLDGSVICLSQGNSTERAITEFMRKNGATITILSFSEMPQAVDSFDSGRCDAYTTDRFLMYGNLLKSTRNKDDIEVLDWNIKDKTYGIMVKKGDERWFNVVRWVINAIMLAEREGVTSQDPRKSLTGYSDYNNIKLGLDRDWLPRTLLSQGNYGEIYERNFSSNNKIYWPNRDLNRQCNQGGRICPTSLQ